MPAIPRVGLLKPLLRSAAALLIAALFIYQANARAQDGALDSTFGFLGRQTFQFPGGDEDHVFASSELPDGRLVIAGQCGSNTCIARLRPNGSFDPTFGPQGFGYVRFDQITGVPFGSALGLDMAVLPDGRMAVLGSYDGKFDDLDVYLIRADGTALDTSNGGSGYFPPFLGSYSVYSCFCRIVAQPDGKLLVTAAVVDNTENMIDTGVARILPNLRGLDESFGNQGAETIAFNIQGPNGAGYEFPAVIAVQTDGKILIGTNGLLTSDANGLEFARLLPNGQRDTTFGPNGDGRFTLMDPSHSLSVTSIASDSRQRLVFGGSQEHGIEQNGSDYDVLVGRLTSSGVLDPSFNGTGTYAFQPIGTSGYDQSAQSVAVTGDSIIVASSVPRAAEDEFTYFAVTRLSLSGSPSPAFGGGGTVYYPFISNSASDFPASMLLTRQGIVVSGNCHTAAGPQIVGAARLEYEHIFADTFE